MLEPLNKNLGFAPLVLPDDPKGRHGLPRLVVRFCDGSERQFIESEEGP